MARTVQRLDTLQTAELAEGVEVSLRTAGPLLRMMAWVLDIIVTIAALMVLYWMTLLVFFVLGMEDGIDRIADGVSSLVAFLIWWLYPVIFEAGKKGATVGKRAAGLRVVNESGTRVTVGQAMMRNFIRSMELMLPFLPLVAFFHPRFQRLGDMAAGTLVVYAKDRTMAKSTQPPALKSHPVNLALTREEQAAIFAFRDRNSAWSEARRSELVDHLEPLTGARGPEAVSRLLGMARWLEERK